MAEGSLYPSRGLKSWLKRQYPSNLICRDLAHMWAHSTVRRTAGEYERILLCSRCDTIKIQTIDTSGHIVRSRYQYPEAYVRPKGLGRITAEERATIRLAVLKEQK